MKTILITLFLSISFSTQALKLKTLAITPERLKLIQENSSMQLGHQKVEDIANETPEFKIQAREGNPAYRTPFSRIPQMTIDRTQENLRN